MVINSSYLGIVVLTVQIFFSKEKMGAEKALPLYSNSNYETKTAVVAWYRDVYETHLICTELRFGFSNIQVR